MNKLEKYLASIRLQYCSLVTGYDALVVLNAVPLSKNEACKGAMRPAFGNAISVCILLALCLCSSIPLMAQGRCSDIVGTWEYQIEKRKGLFMATETHAMWLIVNKDLAPFETEPPTDSEKGKAYDALSASAMRHTCDGNKVTVQFLYDKNPSGRRGGWTTWEYEIEGDVLTYRTLNKDGSRISEGRMRRVKD